MKKYKVVYINNEIRGNPLYTSILNKCNGVKPNFIIKPIKNGIQMSIINFIFKKKFALLYKFNMFNKT